MASLGIDAIVKLAKTGKKPTVSEGSTSTTPDRSFVTDKPVTGAHQHLDRRRREDLLGQAKHQLPSWSGIRLPGARPSPEQAQPARIRRSEAVQKDLAASAGLPPRFLDRRTPLSRIRNLLHRYPALSPGIVLIVAVIVFGVISPRFFFVNNLSLITQQVAVVGTLAIAQTLVILTAGIDLSVGAIMVLASMVVAQTASQNHVPAVALAAPRVFSSASPPAPSTAFLVTRLKLPPFIVTLGTLNIFIALTLLYSNSASVNGPACRPSSR